MDISNENISYNAHEQRIDQAKAVLFPTIAGLGILANAFVILVIIVTERSRSNRTVANTFVMNLAIADILFMVTLPFYVPYPGVNGFPFSAAACKFTEAVKHVAYHSSILFLTGMSVDRYMAIVHSLQSMQYRTQRNARIACAVLWIVSILTSIPTIMFSTLDEFIHNGTVVSKLCLLKFPGHEDSTFVPYEDLFPIGSGDYDYDYPSDLLDENYAANLTEPTASASNQIRCTDQRHVASGESPNFRAWQYSTFVVFFAIPFIIIILCYAQIWRATAIRKVRSQKAEGYPEQEILQPSADNPNPKQSWKQIQAKVTRMVLVLVSAFIICWLPFQLWIILTLPPGVPVPHVDFCSILHFLITLLAWSNSLVNPILYSITSENFRKRAVTTVSFLRYGYRRTMRMSMTRSSRTGHGFRTEKTDMNLHSLPPGTSPKNDRKTETQLSLPPTPIDKTPPKF